jgi:RNA polymerase sigma-70 factor (ECF subfamily)
MTEDPDLDRLAAKARAGDEMAFGHLVRRLVRPALATAWELAATREDAEEVVQDAFARAWRELPRYDPGRPFAPWFFTILRNLGRNAARRDRRWNTVELEDPVDGGEPADTEDDSEGLAPELVLAALEELSPMQRACFRLVRLEGFPTAEVAAMLGIDGATVRVHIHRATRALRGRLGAHRGGA